MDPNPPDIRPQPARSIARRARPVVGWILFLAVLVGVYRWAEPPPVRAPFRPAAPGPGVHMDDAGLSEYLDGKLVWRVHAASIDVERPPNGSINLVQSATLRGIDNGLVYDAHPRAGGPPVQARFRAGTGRFEMNPADPLSPDLAMTYNAVWRFSLDGGVSLTMSSGERFTAAAITVIELANRRTGERERRVLCERGATLTGREGRVSAASLRYDPRSRVVECEGGARAQFRLGTVAAERAFWSIPDGMVRCPDLASGTVKGIAFQAANVLIDTKHRRVSAAQATGVFRPEALRKGGVT